MIIRSQDKTKIVNFDNIRTIGTEVQRPKDRTMILEKYETIIVGYGTKSSVDLGTYSTEEKAIKVLDMICDACRNIAFIDESAVVFNMPQDSEV